MAILRPGLHFHIATGIPPEHGHHRQVVTPEPAAAPAAQATWTPRQGFPCRVAVGAFHSGGPSARSGGPGW